MDFCHIHAFSNGWLSNTNGIFVPLPRPHASTGGHPLLTAIVAALLVDAERWRRGRQALRGVPRRVLRQGSPRYVALSFLPPIDTQDGLAGAAARCSAASITSRPQVL